MSSRDMNRMSKLKQVEKGRHIQVEPAVRWWARCRCFWKFVPIVISHHRSIYGTFIAEARTITDWNPHLNMPNIALLCNPNSKKRKHMHAAPTYSRQHSSFRIWRKARNSESHINLIKTCSFSESQTYTQNRLTWDLGQNGHPDILSISQVKQSRLFTQNSDWNHG